MSTMRVFFEGHPATDRHGRKRPLRDARYQQMPPRGPATPRRRVWTDEVGSPQRTLASFSLAKPPKPPRQRVADLWKEMPGFLPNATPKSIKAAKLRDAPMVPYGGKKRKLNQHGLRS